MAMGKQDKPFCFIICLAYKTRARVCAYLIQRFWKGVSEQIPGATKRDTGVQMGVKYMMLLTVNAVMEFHG